jgi:hypothetical protein
MFLFLRANKNNLSTMSTVRPYATPHRMRKYQKAPSDLVSQLRHRPTLTKDYQRLQRICTTVTTYTPRLKVRIAQYLHRSRHSTEFQDFSIHCALDDTHAVQVHVRWPRVFRSTEATDAYEAGIASIVEDMFTLTSHDYELATPSHDRDLELTFVFNAHGMTALRAFCTAQRLQRTCQYLAQVEPTVRTKLVEYIMTTPYIDPDQDDDDDDDDDNLERIVPTISPTFLVDNDHHLRLRILCFHHGGRSRDPARSQQHVQAVVDAMFHLTSPRDYTVTTTLANTGWSWIEIDLLFSADGVTRLRDFTNPKFELAKALHLAGPGSVLRTHLFDSELFDKNMVPALFAYL